MKKSEIPEPVQSEVGTPARFPYHLEGEKRINDVWHPAGETVYLTDEEAGALGLTTAPRPNLPPLQSEDNLSESNNEKTKE